MGENPGHGTLRLTPSSSAPHASLRTRLAPEPGGGPPAVGAPVTARPCLSGWATATTTKEEFPLADNRSGIWRPPSEV